MNQTPEKLKSTTPILKYFTKVLRDHCGVVMQDGYVFNDTIAENIAVGENEIDQQKLQKR